MVMMMVMIMKRWVFAWTVLLFLQSSQSSPSPISKTKNTEYIREGNEGWEPVFGANMAPKFGPKGWRKICVCLLAINDTLCLHVSITKKHAINDVAWSSINRKNTLVIIAKPSKTNRTELDRDEWENQPRTDDDRSSRHFSVSIETDPSYEKNTFLV